MTLSLPTELVGLLHMVAEDRDETVDRLVRGILDREAMRLKRDHDTREAREHRIARLRLLLAPDMRRATGWAELQARLALYGVELRDGAAGLMLHDLITGEALCPSAALGFGARDLAARFGGPLLVQRPAA
ncbi:MAG: hypothetical protein KDK53_22315, partial [Maritimibacter sp.]|nr:hypothetical protein [Maritimibacter sp.]